MPSAENNAGAETTKHCCSPARNNFPIQRNIDTRFAPRAHQTNATLVSLEGGRFLMGTKDASGFPLDGEGPVRPVVLSPFAIERTPVTNADFQSFAEQANYLTDAERYGWSFVFWTHIPEERFERDVADTVSAAPWWCKVYGASWKHPEGPSSDVSTRFDHPVVHVSFNDAKAYATWAGRRLPTEAEWEYAARGGLEQKLYPWGDELTPEGRHLCNIWQGEFPTHDSGEDGYAGTNPVHAFPPNEYGLYSMAGNVWEWTNDWFGVNHPPHEVKDPPGPPGGSGKVMKGGSFLCHASYCNRYRVAARTQNTPDSSTSNLGFRCVL